MQVEAVVTRIEDQQAIVKVIRTDGGCGRCHEPGGCRSAMLTDALGPRCGEYAIDNVLAAPQGARVFVEVPDGAGLRAAVLAYAFPLLLILCGAGLGRWATRSDAWTAVGAVLALLLAGVILRVRRATPAIQTLRPRMLRIISER